MRNTYFDRVKKLSETDKNTINNVYRSLLLASQEMFFEAYLNGGDIIFPIAEGTIKYDVNKGRGIFIPHESFKKLLENSENKEMSNLLSRELDRFSSLVQLAYLGFQDKEGAVDAEKKESK